MKPKFFGKLTFRFLVPPNLASEKCPPELRISARVQHESCPKKWKKNLGIGPNVGRCQTKNSGGGMLGYFFGYLLTEKITQHSEKCPPELRFSAGVQHESCPKKWKKNLGLGPRVGRRLTKNSGEIFLVRLGYFSVISITEVRLGITQPDEKWSPKLRIFAGVQRESCSKKWKKNLGLGPNVGRRLTKNSGDARLHYFSVIS